MLHKHRIIPGHMGGTYEANNVVLLTIEEHAEAHKKLYEKHKKTEDRIAWLALEGTIGQEEIISMKLSMAGKKHKGRKCTWGEKISAAKKGTEPWNKGKKGVQKSTRKGVPRSEEDKQKIAEGTRLGMKKSSKKAGRKKGSIPWNKGISQKTS